MIGSLQEVTISNFFQWNLPRISIQHQDRIKKKTKRKKAFQKVIITTEDLELVSQTKIAYSDFLKRP